jgi:hypothetical protein
VAGTPVRPGPLGDHGPARPYRTIQIRAGQHLITAADPIPDDLRHAIDTINGQPERGSR